jgi:Tfp pilus assembly protein PilV
MSTKTGATAVVVVASVGVLGLVAALTYAYVDMRKQRDVAVASATNLARQIAAIGKLGSLATRAVPVSP